MSHSTSRREAESSSRDDVRAICAAEAVGDDNYVLPDPNSVVAWHMKYNEVEEDE